MLVVDDNPLVANTFVMVLTIGGFDAVPAYSGTEAIELARKIAFEVLLSDVLMAQMNGIETAMTIRKIRPNCRVVLISGTDVTSGLLSEAELLGNKFEILPKPVHPSVLLDFLRAPAATHPSQLSQVHESMRNESGLQSSPKSNKQESLESVLDQNVHVQNLVQESAEELSSVNAGIKEEIANQECPPGFEQALEKSEAVEGKVQEASDRLAVVNLAIQGEIEEREGLDRKLTEVTEQGEVDRRAALHDPLTDLPNRALFLDRLEHGFQQAKRHGWSLVVMFVDLDNFKVINDTYGHETGDKVLKVIAGRLVEGTRGEDTVCRHGGDEFLILINEAPEPPVVALIAKKLIGIIQSPYDIPSRDVTVSGVIQASIGIASFPQHGSTPETLISSADRAMYVAKRSKSGYSFAL